MLKKFFIIKSSDFYLQDGEKMTFMSTSPLENHLKVRQRMRNRKQKLHLIMKQENNSSPQLSIYEDRKGMREWKAAEPKKLIPRCWQRDVPAPPNPASCGLEA